MGSTGVKDGEIERGFLRYLCDLCVHCVQEPVLGESKLVRDKQIRSGTRHPFYKSFSRRRIFERSCEPRAPSPASTLVKVISDAAPVCLDPHDGPIKLRFHNPRIAIRAEEKPRHRCVAQTLPNHSIKMTLML